MALIRATTSGSGGGGTFFSETIPDTGSEHTYEYRANNAMGYCINTSNATRLAFVLENGVLRKDVTYYSSSTSFANVAYNNGTLTVTAGNGLNGNTISIFYQ